MKTSELTGVALDWAVAKCKGFNPKQVNLAYTGITLVVGISMDIGEGEEVWTPSTSWAQGGPIIEREVIVLTHPKHDCWTATAQDSTDLDVPLYQEDGLTPLIAAMRCYVASKLGDEVEIPEEINREHS